MKTSRRHLLCKTSWRSLEDILKASSKRLKDVLKMSWRRFCKTSWRRLVNVLKRSWQDVFNMFSQEEYIGLDQDVLKTSSEDVWLRRIYWSWWRRLEDVFWRRGWKTSSRSLQDAYIKRNVCWVTKMQGRFSLIYNKYWLSLQALTWLEELRTILQISN